jgi:hypothetical protein
MVDGWDGMAVAAADCVVVLEKTTLGVVAGQLQVGASMGRGRVRGAAILDHDSRHTMQ